MPILVLTIMPKLIIGNSKKEKQLSLLWKVTIISENESMVIFIFIASGFLR